MKTKFKKGNITLYVYQKDFEPYFGAYAEGSFKSGKPLIALNIGSLASMVANKAIDVKDIPEFIASTLFHEFLHVVEDWAGVAFSEKRVNRLVNKYIKAIKELESKQ